jgi:hypothetical protein
MAKTPQRCRLPLTATPATLNGAPPHTDTTPWNLFRKASKEQEYEKGQLHKHMHRD